jgi:PKD repeat protein
VKSVSSAAGYADGAWHHVVATLSGQGMYLYLDGAQVGFSADTKSGMAFGTQTGYWRMGGDTLVGLPGKPTSDYLSGDIDEMAVYPVALTANQVQTHHTLGATGVAPNLPPQAAFSSSLTPLKVKVDGSSSTDSDGTIASYAWDFGDGATDTGATASHTYSAAGSYTVALTVTDDRGATSTSSQSVTVAKPVNVAPTAKLSVASDGLAVTADGSGSADSDGTISSYAWSYGDGGTDTGATASHHYAAAGAYVIRLTVTDDGGATDTATKAVTVPTGNTTFALDEFTRSQDTGLGSADVGGAWTASPSSGFAVSGGSAVIKLSTPGISRTAYLDAASQDSADASTSFSVDQPATGGGIYATVIGRRVSADDDYRATVRITATNAVTVSLASLQGSGTAIPLGGTVTLGSSYAAGSAVHVRTQVTGTSPTTIKAKVWLGSDAEPDAWTVTATDSYAALQAPGSIGLVGYLSGSATGAPVNLAFHRLVATS